MRSFLLFPVTLSLALASLAQADTARSQAIKYGRSETSLVDAREVDAALDVLRRANYDFEEHLAKRSDSWSWKENGNVCYCKSDKKHHSKHPSSKTHEHKPTPTPKKHKHHTHHHDEKTKHHPKPSGHGPHKPEPTGKGGYHHHHHHHQGSCPSGYKSAGRGETLVYNDNDAVDLKDLTVILDILSFSSGKDVNPKKSNKPAKDQPKCEDKYCCYKPQGGKHHGGSKAPTCPSGYKTAKRGDTFITNDNDVVDAQNLDIDIDILSFSKSDSKPKHSSQPAKKSPKCTDEYCCYKAAGSGSGKGKTTCPAGYTHYSKGDTIVTNDNDLVDLKDVTITLNILSYSKPDASPKESTKSPKDAPKCEDDTCCVKQSSKSTASTTVVNDNDIVDAKGTKVSICVLSLCI